MEETVRDEIEGCNNLARSIGITKINAQMFSRVIWDQSCSHNRLFCIVYRKAIKFEGQMWQLV